MKRNFKDKVVLVTGASGNLGQAICRHFALAGAKIAALDINPEALDQLYHTLKREQIELSSWVCDITQKQACYVVVKEILEQWGRIDVLVNNAGITHIEPYRQMDKGKNITQKVMEVNFFGAVYCLEAVLDQLCLHKGLIVTISSVAGFAPLLGRTAYAASKHALHGFFESLRGELQEEGVHCLMVCPSFIQAPSTGGNSSIYQHKKTIGKTTSADAIAQDIIAYSSQNKPLLIAGKTGKISYWLHRFLPKIYEYMMIKKLKQHI